MPEVPIASGDGIHFASVRCDLPVGFWELPSGAGELEDTGGQSVVDLALVGTPGHATGLTYPFTANGAADLNGSSQAYTRSDAGDNLLDVGDTFTLEAWIKPDSVTGNHTLLSKGANGFQLRTNGTTVELLKEGVGSIVATTGVTLATATLYHVVAVKDGASSCQIFVNAVDRSGSVTDRTCASTSTNLNIGRKSDASEYYDGKIDDVAVYAYALTEDQIVGHYLAGLDGTFGESPLGHDVGEGDLPRIRIEIAPEGDWNETYPRWHDVTDRLRSRSSMTLALSGRGDENAETQPGSAAMTFDVREDRLLDPTYDAGAYQVGSGCPIRARACWNGTHYWLWKGWVESWLPAWPSAGLDATVHATCTDILGRLNGIDFEPETALDEAASGSRIGAVLDLVSIPANQRNIDAGIATMPAVDEASGSLLSHLLSVATSDGGFLYAAPDGRIAFESRTYRPLNESASRGTFGDARDGVEMPVVSLEPAADDAYLYNKIRISSGDGTGTGYAEDAASIARRGPRTLSKSLLTGYNEAQAAAEWYLARYKDGETRLPTAILNGRTDPDLLWDVILELGNSHRYTYVVRPLGGGTISVDQFVERKSSEIGGGNWITTLSLTPFGDEEIWVLDDTDYVLGTNTYPTW